MKLSKNLLMKKFPELKKFENQKWISEEAIKQDCNYNRIPLEASFAMIRNAISFLDQHRFSNNWEMCHSVKIRLQQIEDLLCFFCEKTIEEKTLKGENINHQQGSIH
jgi:hypothetical protein